MRWHGMHVFWIEKTSNRQAPLSIIQEDRILHHRCPRRPFWLAPLLNQSRYSKEAGNIGESRRGNVFITDLSTQRSWPYIIKRKGVDAPFEPLCPVYGWGYQKPSAFVEKANCVITGMHPAIWHADEILNGLCD